MSISDPEFIAALRDGARDVLSDRMDSRQLHRFVDDDARTFDRDMWRIAADLGWLMLAVPEAHGGLGTGMDEVATLQRELARSLAPLPFASTVLVQQALANWPHQALAAELLPSLAAGELVGAVGQMDRVPTLQARGDGDSLRIDGQCQGVFDGAGADLFLVELADERGTRGLALLTRSEVEIKVQPVADRTRSLVTLTCRDAPLRAAYVVFGDDAARIADQLLDSANILIANDAIGAAEAACEMTVEYLKTRVQFGKPIGSFQALKHRAADHKVAIEAARRLVERAQTASPDVERYSLWAALAKMSASEAFVAMAADMIQMHGGIGFTWEHDAHLFLKRAMLDQFLFGSTAAQLDRAAALMLAQEAA